MPVPQAGIQPHQVVEESCRVPEPRLPVIPLCAPPAWWASSPRSYLLKRFGCSLLRCGSSAIPHDRCQHVCWPQATNHAGHDLARRRELTDALAPAAGDIAAHVGGALDEAGAFDPTDGLITRDWALGLMTAADEHVGPLTARGLSAGEVRSLVDLVQRHPPPAAGG